ncbi:histidine phosphatase family protein [Colwellia echini]|uniref:phosphoglycerate mutase (2,3-diphosphoglycerate-dependent) n=1 Tax=Colwellia echini TaxID=1982103 RepID=A0ABY3MXN7_9GAMM|nr:histidine phosphatase family protein [Colwellia echini]TYK65975.1 histidine phosphatase family protein [Colwellia echini]
MKTVLYLARHGQTQWNKLQRFQGQLDSDLTPLGKLQSEQLALQLIDKKIDLIVASTLGRAVDSAVICQQTLNIPIYQVTELTERNLGAWQGKEITEIKHDENYYELLHQFTELAPKSGESAIKCGKRISNALEALAVNHPNKRLLVIFHGEALRCFLARLGNTVNGNAYELYKNGCVLPLTYSHADNSFKHNLVADT